MTNIDIATKELLARRLEAIDAPQWLIDNARRGLYDDFDDNGHETPQLKLLEDLMQAGAATNARLADIVVEVKDGKWDAQKWESDLWAAKQTGEMGRIIDTLGLRKETK